VRGFGKRGGRWGKIAEWGKETPERSRMEGGGMIVERKRRVRDGILGVVAGNVSENWALDDQSRACN